MHGLTKILGFVPTSDPKRARAFYEGLLGFRFVVDDQFALVLDAHGTMIRLFKMKDFTPAPYTIVGWEVQEIESLISDLSKRGISFEKYPGMKQDNLGVWTAPNGDKVAWFKDPDGNILSLSAHHQSYAQP